MTSYLVHHSHEPIIDPAVYERVQRELTRRHTVRTKKAGVSNPFANRLICRDCGAFYGHKVWRCNHRYTNEKKCATPILRESEIKMAFVGVLERLGRSECEYTETLWYELVEEVVIYEDRRARFRLANGGTIHARI